MKTWMGIVILIVVASALGIGLYFFSQGSTAPTEEGKAFIETLNLQDTCASGLWDECCTAECNSFCSSQGLSNAQTNANKHLCTCWCE